MPQWASLRARAGLCLIAQRARLGVLTGDDDGQHIELGQIQ